MPELPDNRALKAEARELMRTARPNALRFTAFFLAVDLLLTELSTAASFMLYGSAAFLPRETDLPHIRLSPQTMPYLFAGVFISLLSTVLLAGYSSYCLGAQRGEAMRYASLFDAVPFAGRVILLTLAQGLLIAVGLVLFVVPGIIFCFSYAFAIYFLCENPEEGVVSALRRSRLALRGYKWRLFTLLLSFLPLLFLLAIPVSVCEYFLRGIYPYTLGAVLIKTTLQGLCAACASVYTMPYMALSQVALYRRLTAPKEPAGEWPDRYDP